MQRILGDAALAARLRAEGRELVERDDDRDIEMDRLGELYASLAAMRRALMLGYAFPPLGGAGVQRTLKFVKYLPEQGWDPTVVRGRRSPYQMRDPTSAPRFPLECGCCGRPSCPWRPTG